MAEYKISYFAELKDTIAISRLESLQNKRLSVFGAEKKRALHIFRRKRISKFPENLLVVLKAATRANLIDLTL
jgi:hypothetical protein